MILIFNYNSNLRAHFIDIPTKVFKDNHHMAHFLTAIEIYKNNKLLGSGLKSFRNECKKSKYENINSKFTKNRCSTHPHNIYLEILSETGLLGFIFILLINLYILQYLIFNFLEKKSYKNEILVLFCNFLYCFGLFKQLVLFSTWNGVFTGFFFHIFFI